jgi:hypothetical protein
VTEQFLHGPDIAARLKQVGGEAMSERVASRRLRDARLSDGSLHRPLYHAFMNVVADDLTRVGVYT